MKSIMTLNVIKCIVFTIGLMLPIRLGTTIIPNDIASGEGVYEELEDPSPMRIVFLDLKGEYCDTRCYLNKNDKTVDFITKTFSIDKNTVVNYLIDINKNDKYIESNIGRVKDLNGELIDYGSFEKGLIEFLFNLRTVNPSLFDETWVPYNGDSEYVEDLIKYFARIYDNVDPIVALSIGASESGYYKVTYMLNYNNVFGGMCSSGLIQYKNIEYGVLSYIRLLSYNYYGVGLDTVESIGAVYNPVFVDGIKIANPHWVNLVYNAIGNYKDTSLELSIDDLIRD